MIQIDSEVELPQEEEGKEFGYIPFQQLPEVQTEVITECLANDSYDLANQAQGGKSKDTLQEPRLATSSLALQHDEKTTIDLPINLPVPDAELRKLQEQDKETRRLIDLFNSGKMDKKLYSMDNYILKRVLVEDGIMYYPVVLPDLLRDCVLMLAHDKQGHNGALRVYNSIRRLYYWKGMKKQIRSHCSRCITCAKFNTKAQEFVKSHFTSPLQPMEFISMDLIGEFSPPSSQGHRYALTAVCMLTSYTWCIPLKNSPVTG